MADPRVPTSRWSASTPAGRSAVRRAFDHRLHRELRTRRRVIRSRSSSSSHDIRKRRRGLPDRVARACRGVCTRTPARRGPDTGASYELFAARHRGRSPGSAARHAHPRTGTRRTPAPRPLHAHGTAAGPGLSRPSRSTTRRRGRSAGGAAKDGGALRRTAGWRGGAVRENHRLPLPTPTLPGDDARTPSAAGAGASSSRARSSRRWRSCGDCSSVGRFANGLRQHQRRGDPRRVGLISRPARRWSRRDRRVLHPSSCGHHGHHRTGAVPEDTAIGIVLVGSMAGDPRCRPPRHRCRGRLDLRPPWESILFGSLLEAGAGRRA